MSTPTIFSYTLLDTNGVKASTRAYIGYNGAVETVDALIGNWLELGGLVDAASNGQIVDGSINIPVLPDGSWKSAPVAGTDVSDVIVANFSVAATKYVQEFIIPAFLTAIVTGGQIDLANVALAALLAALDNTAGLTSADVLNTAGQTLTAARDVFQSDRKSRRLPSMSKVYP